MFSIKISSPISTSWLLCLVALFLTLNYAPTCESNPVEAATMLDKQLTAAESQVSPVDGDLAPSAIAINADDLPPLMKRLIANKLASRHHQRQQQQLNRAHSQDNTNNDNESDGPQVAKKRASRVVDLSPDIELDLYERHLAKRQQQRQQEKQAHQKMILKKRWHKLMDDLIDGQFPTETNPSASPIRELEGETEQEVTPPATLNRRKKFAPSVTNDSNDKEKLTILLHKPSLEDSDRDQTSAPSGDASNGFVNDIDQVESSSVSSVNSRLERSPSRKPVMNMRDHDRRVINDDFGIRRDSIWTTNNHLGLRKVPKLGSDEEY